MILALVLLRALAEVPSPAELVGDRVPVKPFLNLIGLVGSYGRLKALSVAGVVASTMIAGAVLGAVYARVTERQRQASPSLGRFDLSPRALVVLATRTGCTARCPTEPDRDLGPLDEPEQPWPAELPDGGEDPAASDAAQWVEVERGVCEHSESAPAGRGPAKRVGLVRHAPSAAPARP